MDIIISCIAAASGIIGVAVGGFITYSIEKLKLKNIESQKREQVYSQLNGRKSLASQLYKSYFEALIWSYYYHSLEKLGGSDQPNWLLEKKRSDDLALEKAKSNQSLSETIGLIQILFPSTNELNELIKPLLDIDEKFKFIKDPTKEIRDEETYQDWKYDTNSDDLLFGAKDAIEKLEKTIELDIENPIDKLLNHLKSYIHEETKTKLYWKFWKKGLYSKKINDLRS
jgi:hypothetical protein